MNAVVTPPPAGAPSAVQARLAALRTEAAQTGDPNSFGNNTPPVTPSAPDNSSAPVGTVTTPPVTPPQTPPSTPPQDGERITMTRQEYNELRADAQRAITADGRSQTLQLSLDELQHRLTTLENGGNAGVTPPAASAPASPRSRALDWNTAQEDFTPEELKDYEQSAAYVDKRARNVVRAEMAPFVDKLNQILGQLGQSVEATTGTLQHVRADTFKDALTKLAPDYRDLIQQPLWGKFIQGVEPLTRTTYGELLGRHIGNGDADGAAEVYKVFRDQYVQPQTPPSAFAGTSGGGSETPSGNEAPATKLKFSERKKLSDDYKFGRISYEKLQEFNTRWAAAEKNGDIDYNS